MKKIVMLLLVLFIISCTPQIGVSVSEYDEVHTSRTEPFLSSEGIVSSSEEVSESLVEK